MSNERGVNTGGIPFSQGHEPLSDEHREDLTYALKLRKWNHRNRVQVFGARLLEKTEDKVGRGHDPKPQRRKK